MQTKEYYTGKKFPRIRVLDVEIQQEIKIK